MKYWEEEFEKLDQVAEAIGEYQKILKTLSMHSSLGEDDEEISFIGRLFSLASCLILDVDRIIARNYTRTQIESQIFSEYISSS